MVRTRSDIKGVRISGKAPRKFPASSNNNGGSSRRSSRKYEGGNSYCPRETPPWQKEITKFFPSKDNDDGSSSRDNDENSSRDDDGSDSDRRSSEKSPKI